MKKATWILIATTTLFFASCEPERDGPTRGKITIAADESLRPLVEAEVEAFNALYPSAHIDVTYLSESDAVDLFMKDSVPLAVVTRHLTPAEQQYFKDKKVGFSEIDVATSGIALIVHNDNPTSNISVAQISSLMKGEITTWNQLGGRSNAGIEIVFDNPNSGLIRQLKDSIAKVDKLPANCFAAANNEAVVDHVSKNEGAIGLIGLEWISDRDDSTTNQFLSKVKVMAVSGDSTHFQPFQAYIALRYYPLTRRVTVINDESRTGLNTGFASFFRGEKGQRIVLKAGLVPKTMPVRIIQVNPKPFKIEK